MACTLWAQWSGGINGIPATLLTSFFHRLFPFMKPQVSSSVLWGKPSRSQRNNSSTWQVSRAHRHPSTVPAFRRKVQSSERGKLWVKRGDLPKGLVGPSSLAICSPWSREPLFLAAERETNTPGPAKPNSASSSWGEAEAAQQDRIWPDSVEAAALV